MCGIAGVVDALAPPNSEILDRLAASLRCRGPDDEGRLLRPERGVGLVHRRLSIIDLAGGRQPIANEDETLALVCNGEVYDFAEKREALAARGHRFRTGSDNEVILHLYEERGEVCLTELNGMFAFAIVHLPSGEVFLARDRFGQKPLFYAQAGARFAFASGPAALATLPWVDSALEPTAIHDYFEYQYVPTPRSIYRGVRKVPPGSWARWDGTGLTLHPYWQRRLSADRDLAYADAQGEVRTRLSAAVKRRLVADVPLGAFLSGGMDSSLICALAQREGGRQLSTFSIGFPEAKYDERAYAAAVAAHLGTDHHFLEVDPGSFAGLAAVVASFEEPFCDASMLPTALLARFTRQHVTVALSGDGADELFGGYYRTRVLHLLRALAPVPQGLRAAAGGALLRILPPKREERTFWGRLRRLVELAPLEGLARYRRLITRFPEGDRRGLYQPDFAAALGDYRGDEPLAALHRSELDPTDAFLELEISSYLPDDILVKVDRASMACSLEVRSPFLDPTVAELAFALPYRFKQRGRSRKRLLADAFAHLLPKPIFARPKMGFGVPLARWVRGPWLAPVRERLLESPHLAPFFRREALAQYLQTHVDGAADHSYGLFALVVLALWLEEGCADR